MFYVLPKKSDHYHDNSIRQVWPAAYKFVNVAAQWCTPALPALGRKGLQELEGSLVYIVTLQGSPSYIVRPCLKNKETPGAECHILEHAVLVLAVLAPALRECIVRCCKWSWVRVWNGMWLAGDFELLIMLLNVLSGLESLLFMISKNVGFASLSLYMAQYFN